MAIISKVQGTTEYLSSDSITAAHGFTTRLGGVSAGHLASLNIGMHRGDEPENVAENFRILGDAIGFDPEKVVLTHQIHTDMVRVVTKNDCVGLDHHAYPECDALVTAEKGLALVIFTADCTPILLHDPITGAVGAAHAGWRGTAMDIAGKTARVMADAFGCDVKNIRAAIGPNIGPCHFQTDADVPDAMVRTFGHAAKEYIRRDGQKYYVNLKAINALSLRRAGVEHIDISDACTACQPHKFWSHRLTGGNRGSQGAVIVCGEGMA